MSFTKKYPFSELAPAGIERINLEPTCETMSVHLGKGYSSSAPLHEKAAVSVKFCCVFLK